MTDKAKQAYIKGLQEYKRGDYQRSEDSFTNAINLGIHEDDIFLYRSICRTHLNNYPGALSDLTYLLDIHPDNSEYRFRRGYAYYKREQFSFAVRDFSTIPESEERFMIRWHYSAVCYYKTGQYTRAMQACEMALQYDTTIPKIWFNTGIILSALNRNDQALLAIEVAERLQPQLAQMPRIILD